MGTFQDVRQYIESRLGSSWSDTDIAYDNRDYIPDPNKAFIHLVIDEGYARQITYNANENATHRYEGFISVFVNVPLKSGTNIARGYADGIADIFRNAQFSVMDILCKTSKIVRIGEVNGMFQYSVLTPFQVDVTQDNAS